MDQITRLIPQGLARIAKQAQAAQAAVAQQGGLETAKRFWKNHGQLKFGKLMGEDSFGNKCANLSRPTWPFFSSFSFYLLGI